MRDEDGVAKLVADLLTKDVMKKVICARKMTLLSSLLTGCRILL